MVKEIKCPNCKETFMDIIPSLKDYEDIIKCDYCNSLLKITSHKGNVKIKKVKYEETNN